MPQTLILMADTRDPLVEDCQLAPYYSLAAAINFDYAKRHGYAFRYYRINGAEIGLAPQTKESRPRLPNEKTSSLCPTDWRRRLTLSADLCAMSFLRFLSGLLDKKGRMQDTLSRTYSRVRPYVLPAAEQDTPDDAEKQRVCCNHREWGARASPWGKLLAVDDAMAQVHDRIVYVDSDAVFVQPEVSVDDFLTASSSTSASVAEADLTLLSNHPWIETEANTGFMVWRNTPNARRLLRHWWDVDAGEYHFEHDYDQHALNQQLLKDSADSYRRQIAIIPTISLVERNGQYIRHVSSPHRWERVPRFRRGLKQSGLNGAAYQRLIRELGDRHLTLLANGEGQGGSS